MSPFERQQHLLSILREQPGLKIAGLAERLGVSAGTVRNDLNALEKSGRLARVRGGAVLDESRSFGSGAFAARTQINPQAKDRIARLAADLVEEGDTILLDASSTTFAMVPYLKKFNSLTVVTNGLPVGMALAQILNFTVILVGGIVRPGIDAVTGHLAEKTLEGLHVKTAFVSCSGLSLESGLTEVDIHEVEVKREMVACAERVVAVVDASKFGRADLSPFARLDQITQVITDRSPSPKFIEGLRQACTALLVFGEEAAISFVPCGEATISYKIGFAGLSEEVPFAVDVRRSLERAAKEAGNLDLVVVDNQLDGRVALQAAETLIAQGVQLAIEYQIDEKVNALLMEKFRQVGIPVIAVDIPMLGATFFGTDNYRAGHLAGVQLGESLQREWGGEFDRLIILEEPRAGAVPAARLQGQLDGLESVIGPAPAAKILHLDSGNTAQTSAVNVAAALARMPDAHRLAVLCFNDDAALGALQAARRAGREADLLLVGQGADRPIREEIRRPGSRVVGSTAFWAERYGPRLVELAQQVLRGELVPPAVYIQPVLLITSKNIDLYYPEARPILASQPSTFLGGA